MEREPAGINLYKLTSEAQEWQRNNEPQFSLFANAAQRMCSDVAPDIIEFRKEYVGFSESIKGAIRFELKNFQNTPSSFPHFYAMGPNGEVSKHQMGFTCGHIGFSKDILTEETREAATRTLKDALAKKGDFAVIFCLEDLDDYCLVF